jgi:hypothetical protein
MRVVLHVKRKKSRVLPEKKKEKKKERTTFDPQALTRGLRTGSEARQRFS